MALSKKIQQKTTLAWSRGEMMQVLGLGLQVLGIIFLLNRLRKGQ